MKCHLVLCPDLLKICKVENLNPIKATIILGPLQNMYAFPPFCVGGKRMSKDLSAVHLFAYFYLLATTSRRIDSIKVTTTYS